MKEAQSNPARIDEVRQQILRAFSNVEMPKTGELIGPTTGDKAEENRLRREMSGKRWQSLNTAFLNERWSSFGYLSDKGYRYYLPALLMRCLDNFSPHNDLLHSTVYSLQPDYWSLYYEDADERFEYQTSLFNREQYGAVCSFLGLVMDTQPDVRFLSAQALRWGWNRQEHPALEKSRAFYRRLHTYEYPPHADEEINRLVGQIRSAFAKTPYPGDKKLCGSDQGDEPAELALEFTGLNWRQLHPGFLAEHYAALSFLSHEGFRYFLPAFLIADLYGNDDSNANPVFHLTHGLAPDKFAASIKELTESGMLDKDDADTLREEESDPIGWRQYAIERFAAFTPPERAAISEYLRFKARDDEYSAPEINHALKTYWLKQR